MKPFSLDVVLDYRKRKEDIAIGRLFTAKRQRDAIKSKIVTQKNKHRKAITDLESTQQVGAEIREIISLEEHVTFSKTKIDELKILLKNKEEQIKSLHSTLLDSSKDRKAMEKLKEKQNDDWQKHLNKKEAAMLDEIAVIHHKR